MCKIFALITVATAVLMVTMFFWFQGTLLIVYGVSSAIWSVLIDLAVWILPSPYDSSLANVVTVVDGFTSSAEWAVGQYADWLPDLGGKQTQEMFLFVLHGTGIFGLITLTSCVAWTVRIVRAILSWFRRKPRQVQYESLF